MNASSISEDLLLKVLHEQFGRNEFRSCQLPIIKAVLAHKDVMVVLPTGHGKSLTFQLPALVESSYGGTKGFYIVISPLLALMKDQIRQLQSLGIKAESINSTTTSQKRQQIMQSFQAGQGSLLYVSPEQCLAPGFGAFVSRCSRDQLIKRIVIDEAHCAVEWGADFRKDYARLGSDFRAKLSGNIPFMALTGTASPQMQEQIKRTLRLKKPVDFRTSSRRPHLHYEVRYIEDPQDKLRDLLQFLKMYRGRVPPQGESKYAGCGIIYCRARASTELIANEINRVLGKCAVAYHAGLSPEDRAEAMAQWVNGNPRFSIVIATIAFGLGIDKPDTRFVIHFDLPSNIEAYAQQTGRGGRDRKAARCILYFSADEAQKCSTFAKPGDAKKSALALIRFATTINRCRHDVLGNHFGDANEGSCDFACDFCKMPQRLRARYDDWSTF